MNRAINELAASFAKLERVEAIVLAGSAATGMADEWSDYDLYAYTRDVVPIEFRAKLLTPRAARLELHNTFWEWSDEWVEPDGPQFDLMYRSCDAIEADVEAKLGRGQAALGYSTSLCHSLLEATPVFDRRGWFQALQNRLKSTPYPDRLVEGILQTNLPVLGGIIHSYEQQIRSAFHRRDRVSLNHRTTAWLASYFDILFAANRRFNPGEKRLLLHAQALPTAPERMAADVEAACTGACSLKTCVADHLEAMRVRLEQYLREQGLLSTLGDEAHRMLKAPECVPRSRVD